MIGRRNIQNGFRIGLVMIGAVGTLLRADSKLSLVEHGSGSLEIQLENDRQVAGVQFVLRSSSGVVLQEMQKSGRTNVGDWVIASNKLDDSTLSIVMFSTEAGSLECGKGVIGELSISNLRSTAGAHVWFEHVVVADPQAQLVSTVSSSLDLNAPDPAAAISSGDISLGQNYPNPFNPSTRLTYTLKKAAQVHLSIFDITGREISRLVDQDQPEGTYSVTWNNSDGPRGQLTSGIYFARLSVGNNVVTRKMILTK